MVTLFDERCCKNLKFLYVLYTFLASGFGTFGPCFLSPRASFFCAPFGLRAPQILDLRAPLVEVQMEPLLRPFCTPGDPSKTALAEKTSKTHREGE
jgi:hypothetical protein